MLFRSGRDCDYLKFCYCVVLEPKWHDTVHVSLKFNGIKFINSIPYRFKRITDMTCNHVWFLKLYESPIDSKDLNQFERKRVEVEFGAAISHILRCGVHAECICPLFQDLFTDTLPPTSTSIPAFPICSISNTVTPSPHLLNSCLELSNSNSMETTYTNSDSPLEGSHDDECDSSLSLYTSPMGRNYPPPQPQATVPDDTSHISLPSTIDLPNNMTDMFESRLGLPGLGIGDRKSVV